MILKRIGNSVEGRARFVLEVLRAMVAEAGADRVGVKISPEMNYNSITDAAPQQTYTYLVEKLRELGLAPDFHDAVLATGRKKLIMAGVTTDVCLIFPAIDAALEGFAVQAVMDASGSPSDLSEEFSRQRMHDAGVVLTATNTLVAEIAKDWSTPAGQQLIGLLFSDVFPALGAGIA